MVTREQVQKIFHPGVVFIATLLLFPVGISADGAGSLGGIENSLSLSAVEIERGNYKKAYHHSTDAINELMILLDALMPLEERIKQRLDDERGILSETLEARKNKGERSKIEGIASEQNLNLVETEKTLAILDKMIGEKAVESGPPPMPKNEQPEIQKQITVLKEVFQLVYESARFQEQAKENLEVEINNAIQDIEGAVDRLKKALEKLKDESGSSRSRQDKEKRAESEETKDQKGNQTRNDSKNGSSSERRDDGQKSAEESMTDVDKMTSREALMELNRLQKQADTRKKQREREFGIIETPGRINVDKDW